ncbi:hypothetical protein [Aeromonas sp. OTU364]|uniref:hypothetical protein n=1 Tax=Aeromonas sp. OTU364 TaxID=3043864 RepID=UPI00313EE284
MVLVPELLVQSMDMEMLIWLAALIVIYTSWTMYASWQAARRQPDIQVEAQAQLSEAPR